MNKGGWSCPHDVEGICDIIKKECDPGDKGCVLFLERQSFRAKIRLLMRRLKSAWSAK
jgi:hypothetical protein